MAMGTTCMTSCAPGVLGASVHLLVMLDDAVGIAAISIGWLSCNLGMTVSYKNHPIGTGWE